MGDGGVEEEEEDCDDDHILMHTVCAQGAGALGPSGQWRCAALSVSRGFASVEAEAPRPLVGVQRYLYFG